MGENQLPDPEVQLALPLSIVNFILGSLDKNPLGASVMETARVIQNITDQTQAALRPEPPEEA